VCVCVCVCVCACVRVCMCERVRAYAILVLLLHAINLVRFMPFSTGLTELHLLFLFRFAPFCAGLLLNSKVGNFGDVRNLVHFMNEPIPLAIPTFF